MKETTKRREKAKESKAEKQKENQGPEAQDVEMPEEDSSSAAAKPAKEQDSITLEDIKEHVKQIEKAVSGKEPRFVLRALRALPSTSRRLNPNVLHKAISGFYTSNAAGKEFLIGFLEEPMDTEGDVQFRPRTGKAAAAPLIPEVEAYLQLLLLVYLINNKRYTEAQKISDDLLQKISSQNRRALDLVAAKCYYYHCRVYEFLNQLDTLEYTEARKTLTNALRKAPQHTAVGFKQTVHKLLIVVELLLGEIPDRLQFRQPSLKRSLMPYFLLTQGVRMISLSYSRISLADIAQKLQLDSPEDAEFIVAKAIRDGVIEASINHEKGYIQSKETMDIYGTREPQLAFHQRISFCLDIHNMSVKAMRFPPKAYNKDLESAEERREREQQDLEFAKEMAEDDDDSFP
ncbi:hypothetical protein HF521_011145 [Silurus meridionalis]|uniref:PCI domain-containing protein n=1 Tax=Silurus meridionalis TaxID=175797 RepID=A0A8T0AEN9_SILME|nr:hypothetical protein HF521_011145 [Silurus meridionalis]